MSDNDRLELLRKIIETNLRALDALEAMSSAETILEGEATVVTGPGAARLSDCDRAVFAFVQQSAASPPTRQEIIVALSECAQRVAAASTVDKSITRLTRNGYIKARPRPVNGYIVLRSLEGE